MTVSVKDYFDYYKDGEEDSEERKEVEAEIVDDEYFNLNIAGKRVLSGGLDEIVVFMQEFIKLTKEDN